MKSCDIFSKDGHVLHHAFFLKNQGQSLPEILEFLGKTIGVKTRGNPDFSVTETESLGIDEARALDIAQSRKSWSGDLSAGAGKKIFVISAFQITREAQNALLKVFEEPTPGTHFFLVMPSGETIIPTLRSRLYVLELEKSKNPKSVRLANDFLKARPPARILLIKKLLEDKNKVQIAELLNNFEELLRKGDDKLKNAPHLKNIIKLRGYLNDRAPSMKMLLEHLALTLPVI